MTRMHIADAVVRGEGTQWTVGTPTVSLSFEAREGLRWQALTVSAVREQAAILQGIEIE